jgi:hypothetical protein
MGIIYGEDEEAALVMSQLPRSWIELPLWVHQGTRAALQCFCVRDPGRDQRIGR